MKRFAAALGLSLLIHAMGWSALSAQAVTAVATVDPVPMDIYLALPAVAAGGRDVATRQPRRHARARRDPWPRATPLAGERQSMPAAAIIQSAVSQGGTGPATGTTVRVAAAVGPAASGPRSGADPGAGAGLGAGADGAGKLDLSPILARLRDAAASCATRHHRTASAAEVRFCVGQDGAPTAATLVVSSGHDDLDRAALDCVIPRAAPFPPLDRCLVVPLRFQ